MTDDLMRPHVRLWWWRPDDIQKFRAAEDTIWPDGGYYYERIEVIIGFDQSNTHEIYLRWVSSK